MPRGVVAPHRLDAVGVEHELDVVVERSTDEVGQRFAAEGDAAKVRADRLGAHDLQLTPLEFVAHTLHTGKGSDRAHGDRQVIG